MFLRLRTECQIYAQDAQVKWQYSLLTSKNLIILEKYEDWVLETQFWVLKTNISYCSMTNIESRTKGIISHVQEDSMFWKGLS